MSPTSGPFRTLCGAAVGYGLTDGGPNAAEISLSALGRRVVAPMEEGDDVRAVKDAVLSPTVERQFLEKYDGSPLPASNIAANVLESLGVPHDRSSDVFALVSENADVAGLLKRIKDKTYVDLGGQATAPAELPSRQDDNAYGVPTKTAAPEFAVEPVQPETQSSSETRNIPTNRRVFISHGKTRRVVEQLKELLAFGDFTPVWTFGAPG